MPADIKQPVDSPTTSIVYLIDFLSYGGGMENQLAWLLKKLDRNRFSPHLVCLRHAKRSNTRDVGCPIEHLSVVRLLSFKAIGAIWRLSRLLRRQNTKILQIFSIDSNLIGVLAGRLAGVPHIVVCRRDMGLWYDSGPLRLVNFINRMANHCLVNSQAVKNAVVARESFGPSQVSVVYNGIPKPSLVDGPKLTRADLGVPDKVPLIGIVANLRPVKRIDRIIRVLGQLENREAHLVIVGMGVEKDSLKKLADSLGLADRVHFYYTVKRTLEVMQLFSVGVLVSESEGLSNVLVEYAIAEIPAVAFDTGGNSEVIIDDETGKLVPSYDIGAMTNTIDSLLVNTEQTARMSRAAADLAQSKFSLEKMIKATQDYYLGILDMSANRDL